ncbi:HAMP domain-containing protein, partial [Solihabitans fulvus]
MEQVGNGNFRRRLVVSGSDLPARVAQAFNDIADRNQFLVGELVRLRTAVGVEGQLSHRIDPNVGPGGWTLAAESVNELIEDLTRPTDELSRVLAAVAEGDLSQRMSVQFSGHQQRGEFVTLGRTVNELLEKLSLFASEVTRVAREVGTEGILGGQADVPGVAGVWRDLTNSVNLMAGNLTS